MHKSKLRRITLAVYFALMPFAADAAGLGKLTVISGLGEPLNAEIELLSATPEELSTLTADIAPDEAYAVQGLERTALHKSIEVEVSKQPDGTPILKLTTRQPVSDPFLDMLIQVDWATGRLLREYTVLLDPPGYSDKAATGSATVNVPAVQAEASETPVEADTSGQQSQEMDSDMTASAPESSEDGEVATEHTTESGDTLSAIAKKMQVEGVSLEQMLVGLYSANEEAFVDGNMNRLKVGQIIRAPSPEELQSVSRSEAAQQVRVHTENWNAYRNKLAGIIADAEPGAEEIDDQTSGGRITAAAEDKAAPAADGPRDVVKLSKSEADAAANAGDSKALQDRINALQEEVTAKEQATQEANERTAMLEKQIADMQKLLAVKNEALAELQKNAAGTPPAAEATEPAAPAEATPPAESAASQPAAAPEQAAEAAKPEAAAQAQPPAGTPADQAKPADAPPQKKIIPPPPPLVTEEPGMLDGLIEDPMLLAAGGGLVLLGGGWLFLRNRRRRNLDSFEQGILTAGGLKANTVFGNTAGGTVDTGDTSFLTDFSQSGGGMIDTHDVDPIAEAEVYMAYGRDAQAEEILKDAIAKEPKRYELHLKLLEILANRKDTAAFETIAGELYSTLGTNDPTWAKVAEMGQQLEPGNPLYDTKGAGAAVAAAAVAGAAAGAATDTSKLEPSDFENAEEIGESSLDFSLGGEAGSPTDENKPAAIGEEPGDTPAAASGLDFNLGEASDSASSEKPLSEMTTMSDSIFGSKEASAEPSDDLDLGLNNQDQPSAESLEVNTQEFGNTMPGLNLPEETAEEKFPEVQLNAGNESGAETTVQPAEEDSGLNFAMPDLGTSDAEQPNIAPVQAEEELPQFDQTVMMDTSTGQEDSELETADENVSFELPDLGAATTISEPEEPQMAISSDAGSDLNFDLDASSEVQGQVAEPAPEEEMPNPSEIDLSGISLDFGPTIDNPEVNNEGSEIQTGASAGESAEVETKLDLVTAYMEMGDKEGARELLDEVLKEGGPQQKERAQEMLNGLG